jgi:hypothetical protein
MKRNKHESTSRSQGGTGDQFSEGRLREIREPMNKNLIKGRRGEASWHHTAKPSGSVPEVNEAVVRRRTALLPGEASGVRAPEESSEVVVVRSKPVAGRDPV